MFVCLQSPLYYRRLAMTLKIHGDNVELSSTHISRFLCRQSLTNGVVTLVIVVSQKEVNANIKGLDAGENNLSDSGSLITIFCNEDYQTVHDISCGRSHSTPCNGTNPQSQHSRVHSSFFFFATLLLDCVAAAESASNCRMLSYSVENVACVWSPLQLSGHYILLRIPSSTYGRRLELTWLFHAYRELFSMCPCWMRFFRESVFYMLLPIMSTEI